ncbi:unnamed protein product, partial [Acanthoscelides obtectus]
NNKIGLYWSSSFLRIPNCLSQNTCFPAITISLLSNTQELISLDPTEIAEVDTPTLKDKIEAEKFIPLRFSQNGYEEEDIERGSNKGICQEEKGNIKKQRRS